MNNIDVHKILVSKKNHMVQKIHINTSLDIMMVMLLLPKMIGYAKHFDSNKTMSFKVSDNKLLKSTKRYGKRLPIY